LEIEEATRGKPSQELKPCDAGGEQASLCTCQHTRRRSRRSSRGTGVEAAEPGNRRRREAGGRRRQKQAREKETATGEGAAREEGAGRSSKSSNSRRRSRSRRRERENETAAPSETLAGPSKASYRSQPKRVLRREQARLLFNQVCFCVGV
jgi:hypothetical protein